MSSSRALFRSAVSRVVAIVKSRDSDKIKRIVMSVKAKNPDVAGPPSKPKKQQKPQLKKKASGLKQAFLK